ncbi:MAG: LysM peptidoglycan-binding domain-containing protein [Polyangiaceae bacterium]
MKRIVCLGMGQGDLWLAAIGQELPKGARVIEKRQAKFWLRQSVPPMAHPTILHALADIAEATGYPFHGVAGFVGLDELESVMDHLGQALSDGRLIAFRTANLEGGGKGPNVEPPGPKPPAPKTSWIKLKFLDDLGAKPVSGVTATLTLSDGQKRDFTTRADGLIDVQGIPSGTCDATSPLKSPKLPHTLTFMGTGETAGGKKDPDDEPIAPGNYVVSAIEQYKVKKGDTLKSIADKAGITEQDLAVFNFGTSDKDAVNTAIRARVGSKTLGPDKKTYVFDDADKPGIVYVPKEWKQDGLATEKTHSMRLRPIVPKWLAILKVDDHFAPSKEKLDIKYSLGGLSKKKVLLEIKSDHYKDGPIFTYELTDKEKKDGEHTFQWDGKSNAKAGDLKDHYIHPLYGPYKVHLYVDNTYTDEAEFKVLYHSVKLQKGPWTPDEKEPDVAKAEKDWVAYKLNELGYWGGPVGKDQDDYLKKAIIRYKANHKTMHELVAANYTDAIDAKLKNALKAGDNKRKDFLEEGAFTDKAKESNIRVEAITYETSGEFGSAKPQYEKLRVNRPVVPVEAHVYLKDKADKEADAPEAVGPVRVNWRFTDKDEDLTSQYDGTTAGEPSKTKQYIEKALKLKSGRTGKGDNCHKDYAGVRDDAKDYVTPCFVGEQYLPYKVEEDGGQKVVFSKGCVDKTKYPKRIGKAGLMFRPSYISGDDYKITAEIDFTGLPNKADLEKFHNVKDEKSRIHAETGTFRVKRFNKVAVVIDWPARSNSYEWDKIAVEFGKAWFELDTSHIASKKMKDVITNAEYVAVVKANTTHTANIKLEDDALVGVPLPAQVPPAPAPAMNSAAYEAALRTYVYDNFWQRIVYPLRDVVGKNIRKEYPIGWVIVNFLTHKPVNIQKNPPADTSIDKASFVTWSSSYGLADSVIFADQKDPDKVYYVVGHEMGHNLWLHHFENAGGTKPAEHDTSDHNCIMSYSSSSSGFAHQAPGTFTPRFCGKCNLKLRGWDVDGGALPASS